MKRIYTLLFGVMALAVVGCIDEVDNSNIPSAKSGDEVQFGLTLPGMTRTIYGDKNQDGTAYPIYWVNGDKVQIYSPQCLIGRNNAEYKVAVENATQNYATSLTPTGANGVQWGTESTADFYSVYPSGEYTIGFKPEGGVEGADKVLTIENLKINFSDEFEVSNSGVVTPKMADCLMIAKTTNVSRGTSVNLKYSPIATSVMVTLEGPTANSSSVQEVQIQSVNLIAPEGTDIAGTFNVQLDDENKYVFSGWSTNEDKSNKITAQLMDQGANSFYKIKAGEKLTIPLFLVPRNDLSIGEGWKVQVVTPNQTFTKSLNFASNASLTPGLVHELPALPPLDINPNTQWDVENWMKNIPRNVYLSEVSIPGTWNSMNSDSQNNTSLSEQYAKGARAFHIDTRWKRTNEGSSRQPSYKYELGVAIGGDDNTTSGDNKYMTAGSTFVEALTEITGNLKSDEYMVLICTFAQNSAQYNGADGWVNAISDACKGNDLVFDAKTLSAETVIGEVLNRLIVIVNMEGAFTSVPSDSKCIFINAPMTIPSLDYFNNDITKESYLATKDTTTPTKSDITFYASHAQISVQGDGSNCGKEDRQDDDRGYIPSYDERRDVALDILKWSKENYSKESYAHDCWIYLGFGGYYARWNEGFIGINRGWKDITNAYELIAADFSKLISDEIDKMATEQNGEMVPYYPVGIVLLNNGVDYASTLKKILLLNNKYRLQFDPNKPTDYNPNAKARSAAASYSSGMQDTGTSAFGWE